MAAGHSITLVAQIFRQIPLHLRGGLVRHRIQMLIELRDQAKTVFSDNPRRLVTMAVILEAMLRQKSAHADVNAWLARIAFWICPQNRWMLGRLIAKLHNVDVMMKLCFKPRVPLHRQCHDTTLGSAMPRSPIRNCATWRASPNRARFHDPEKARA